MLQRGWAFIVKAGTVILVCNFAVHVMQKFNWGFQPVENAADSILHDIATPFAYVIAPILGAALWQFAAAAVTGFIAKENVVGTLAVCFGISNLIDLDALEMVDGAANEVVNAFGITSVAALAFLMFNLFTPPCFAAIGAMNAETKNKKWLFAGLGLQLSIGYTLSFLVFFFGTLFTKSSFGSVWMPITGWAIVGCIVSVLVFLILRKKAELNAASRLGTEKERAKV